MNRLEEIVFESGPLKNQKGFMETQNSWLIALYDEQANQLPRQNNWHWRKVQTKAIYRPDNHEAFFEGVFS